MANICYSAHWACGKYLCVIGFGVKFCSDNPWYNQWVRRIPCPGVFQELRVWIMALAVKDNIPDSKVHGANMGPTWVLSAPDGPHVGPLDLAIRDLFRKKSLEIWAWKIKYSHCFMWYVTCHPCPNFKDGLTKLSLLIGHGWVIILHFYWPFTC